MLKVYMMMGLPGSGKTKRAMEMLAENPNGIKRVSKDDLRAMLDGSEWSGDREKFVLKARDMLILAALEEKKHVVVDDTNLAPKHLARIDQLVAGKASVYIVALTDVPIETCIERDLKRPNSVGQKVIWRMYWQFLHKPKDPPVRDLSLPDCVICDIDGTLALHNGRGPYEFERAGEDAVNESVAKFLSGQDRVIFVTGREEKWRELTEKWLDEKIIFVNRWSINWLHLYMRSTGDVRKDFVVKKEIYEAHIKGKYSVVTVLDDRDQTVAFWRSEGLPCWQVNYGTF